MLPVYGLKPRNAIQYSVIWAVCTRSPPLCNISPTRGLSKYEENRHMDGVHSSLKQDGYSMLIMPRLHMHSSTRSCAPNIFD